MSVFGVDPGDLSGSHVKIGAPSHWARNLGILGLLLLSVVVVWRYNAYSQKEDARKLDKLEALRTSLAEKCGMPVYAEASAPTVQEVYVNSADLQRMVEQQLAALDSGISCEQVIRTLKTAGFTLLPSQP